MYSEMKHFQYVHQRSRTLAKSKKFRNLSIHIDLNLHGVIKRTTYRHIKESCTGKCKEVINSLPEKSILIRLKNSPQTGAFLRIKEVTTNNIRTIRIKLDYPRHITM